MIQIAYVASGLPTGLTTLEYKLLDTTATLVVDWTSIAATALPDGPDLYGGYSYLVNVSQPSAGFAQGVVSFREVGVDSTKTEYAAIAFFIVQSVITTDSSGTTTTSPGGPMQSCILDGYTFAMNPVDSINPPVRSIGEIVTFGGTVRVDWGAFDSDRVIELAWPLIDPCMFTALNACATYGPKTYIDEFGQSWTVLVEAPTYSGYTPGAAGYKDVKLKLSVISRP
jgi:hypothetical protein